MRQDHRNEELTPIAKSDKLQDTYEKNSFLSNAFSQYQLSDELYVTRSSR